MQNGPKVYITEATPNQKLSTEINKNL